MPRKCGAKSKSTNKKTSKKRYSRKKQSYREQVGGMLASKHLYSP